MRALHLYSGNLLGGIERSLVTLSRERSICPEMESSVGLCFQGRLADDLRACGGLVHRLDSGRPIRVRRPWTIAAARRRLAQLIEEQKPDVVLCHSYWPHAIFAPVARRCGLPVVFCAHDVPDGTHWLQRWARLTRPDLVLANSRYTASLMPRLFPSVRCQVLAPPVREPTWSDRSHVREEMRSELKTPPEAVVILMASRLEKCKGHRVLLDALGRLREIPNWICWIAGGPQRPREQVFLEQLYAAADRHGVKERVRFLGQRSDVSRLLAAADIYCQPNVAPDAFGIAFIEALYAGLPVVTSAIGGGGEVVTPSCGLLLEPGDAQALTGALRQLIDDPDRRRLLAAGGPARARELCDPRAILPALHRTLANLCAVNPAKIPLPRRKPLQKVAVQPFVVKN